MVFHAWCSYLASAAVTDQDELEGRSSVLGHFGVVWTRRAQMRSRKVFRGFEGCFVMCCYN
jgi:hypothetical protein